MKAAIVVLSGPDGEESLGRVFNALAAAYDFAQRGDEVRVLFQGAGVRWPALLTDDAHPVHALYASIRGSVAGASHACAAFFDATDGVASAGLELVDGNPVPGTPGLPSLAELVADGFGVITF